MKATTKYAWIGTAICLVGCADKAPPEWPAGAGLEATSIE